MGQAIHRLKDHSACVASLCFSHDSSLLIGGFRSGRVAVWEVAGGQQVREIPKCGRNIEALCLMLNKTLAVFGGADSGAVAAIKIYTDLDLDDL